MQCYIARSVGEQCYITPACTDKEGEKCKKERCAKYTLKRKRNCQKAGDLCGPPEN